MAIVIVMVPLQCKFDYKGKGMPLFITASSLWIASVNTEWLPPPLLQLPISAQAGWDLNYVGTRVLTPLPSVSLEFFLPLLAIGKFLLKNLRRIGILHSYRPTVSVNNQQWMETL